jgi:hypothetical protein
MLCTSGTTQQYTMCGLKTVKQQMKLKKLILKPKIPSSIPSTSTATSDQVTPKRQGKLSKRKIAELTPEDKRMYLAA